VVMLDRRKLAAPLFAQAAAFVAVLVIGGFTGHAPATPQPVHQATPGPSASSSSSSAANRGPALKLTVKAVEQGTAGLPVAGSQVNVLEDGTLASVASGALNSALEFAANVPAGPYQVCIKPPIGWSSADRSTHAVGDWVCSATDVRTGPQLVTFRLISQLSEAGQ
jgi:hypothetical protein